MGRECAIYMRGKQVRSIISELLEAGVQIVVCGTLSAPYIALANFGYASKHQYTRLYDGDPSTKQ